MRWTIFFVALLLAGCSETPPAEEAPPTTTTDAPDEPVFVPPSEPVPVTMYFTADNRLGLAPPAEGEVTLASGYASLAQGESAAEWRSAAIGGPLLIPAEPISMNITVRSDSIAPPDPNGFDLAVWFGSTVGMPLFAAVSDAAVWQAGEVRTMQVTLDFGEQEGLVVPPGESLRIIVLSARGLQSGEIKVLTGGNDTASSVTFPASLLGQDPTTATAGTPETFTGTLTNASFTDCASQPGVSFIEHPVAVVEGVAYLRATMTGPDGADLDLDLYDGDRRISGGHTATANEGIYLAGPTIEPYAGKGLVLRASACLAQNAQYEVVVEQGTW